MRPVHRLLDLVASRPFARRLLWRVGRVAYTAARGDVPNEPRTNGEYWFLERVLREARPGERLLDVGANRGDWTAEALRLGARARGVELHAFEPSAATRRLCAEQLGRDATIHAVALGAESGESTFYALHEGGGSNSLSAIPGAVEERVTVTTLDAFLEAHPGGPVRFVKIDTEGHDLFVLRGAAATLRSGAIEALQFEYNWRWLETRLSLRDLFELLATVPYRLGKLAGPRLELYDAWHPELDRFIETNFVLVRRGSPLEALGVPMAFDATNAAAPR